MAMVIEACGCPKRQRALDAGVAKAFSRPTSNAYALPMKNTEYSRRCLTLAKEISVMLGGP